MNTVVVSSRHELEDVIADMQTEKQHAIKQQTETFNDHKEEKILPKD